MSYIQPVIPEPDWNAGEFVDALPVVIPGDRGFPFNGGYFTVEESGQVSIDYWFDGGGYDKGELAIFSLSGMDDFEPGSRDFIREAARRALSDSVLGRVVIQDASEGAKFTGRTGYEGSFNKGTYLGEKSFQMTPGDRFGIMLVPNGGIEEVFQNPAIEGAKRPLFSLETANPNDAFQFGQIGDVTGNGHTFTMEDLRLDGKSDRDYNDVVFHVSGATGRANPIDFMIDTQKDWRTSSVGQQVMQHVKTVESLLVLPPTPMPTPVPVPSPIPIVPPTVDATQPTESTPQPDSSPAPTPSLVPDAELDIEPIPAPTPIELIDPTPELEIDPIEPTDSLLPDDLSPLPTPIPSPTPVTEIPKVNQPLVGIIDTGLVAEHPDLDYSNLTLGRDYVDGDLNPLLQPGEGSLHGTKVTEVIAAIQNNGIGSDGVNDDAPLWISRAIVSGKWAEALTEFVDAAQASGQPNAIANLSFDLTQRLPDGSVVTRYELTQAELAAIAYARDNSILIVAAAGNEGGQLSAIAQAAIQFDNILTVGAAENGDRHPHSNFGAGLALVAPSEELGGTSIATAQVTGAVSQVWATNPHLTYKQVIDILKTTAIDIGEPGWDEQTGAGLLNLAAAIGLAKITAPSDSPIVVDQPTEIAIGQAPHIPQERPTDGFWGSLGGVPGTTVYEYVNSQGLNVRRTIYSDGSYVEKTYDPTWRFVSADPLGLLLLEEGFYSDGRKYSSVNHQNGKSVGFYYTPTGQLTLADGFTRAYQVDRGLVVTRPTEVIFITNNSSNIAQLANNPKAELLYGGQAPTQPWQIPIPISFGDWVTPVFAVDPVNRSRTFGFSNGTVTVQPAGALIQATFDQSATWHDLRTGRSFTVTPPGENSRIIPVTDAQGQTTFDFYNSARTKYASSQYTETGKIAVHTYYDATGKTTALTRYDTTGKTTLDVRYAYVNGTLWSEEFYDADGKRSRSVVYWNDYNIVWTTEFYPNGDQKSISLFNTVTNLVLA